MTRRVKRSYTITEEADKIMKVAADKQGISKTAVLEMALREYAERKNIIVTVTTDKEPDECI